ncbi:MAG: glucuronate isomerase [Nibricoccus sp.]
MLTSNRVNVVCTTDDPMDDLAHHIAIKKTNLGTKVYPTFRPDKALIVNAPAVFNAWCDQLAARSNKEVKDLASFLDALDNRHAFFHSLGGRVSDHGMENIPDTDCTENEAKAIFAAARSGAAADA